MGTWPWPGARAGVECTGSYGAGLTRYLLSEGVEVVEVNQPDKATRRRRGKTDTIDAQAAAQAVISGRAARSACPGHGRSRPNAAVGADGVPARAVPQ
ncbi:transposase [Kribbella sp. NBC_00889]|uniref:IS110 family transposase n=1 Tax=Kribbella sp. NBC_00889 TaxID=2975974 RepID=UPI0038666FBE|nr:IS110 family transposase [Kribbella sp. NBC_00889]